MKRNCYDLKTSSIEKIFDSIIIIYILVLVYKNKKKLFHFISDQEILNFDNL